MELWELCTDRGSGLEAMDRATYDKRKILREITHVHEYTMISMYITALSVTFLCVCVSSLFV